MCSDLELNPGLLEVWVHGRMPSQLGHTHQCTPARVYMNSHTIIWLELSLIIKNIGLAFLNKDNNKNYNVYNMYSVPPSANVA